jgi:hypothetical protein
MAEKYHPVYQGDSLTSIAFEHGFDWEKLWNYSRNADLKSLRQDPHVLYPGDVVYLPDKELRMESCATDAKHTFVRNVPLDRLRIRFLRDFAPRANEEYVLIIDRKRVHGFTDGDGMVDELVHPSVRRARLLLQGGSEQYEVSLGHLDPVETVEGLQGRLRSMGFFAGEITGEMDEETTSALKAFQASHGHAETDEPHKDTDTINKLKADHAC